MPEDSSGAVHTAFVPRRFHSIEAAIVAIGDKRRVDYLPTLNGKRDLSQRFAYVASELAVSLRERGFDPKRGDFVEVWLPAEAGEDMLGAS